MQWSPEAKEIEAYSVEVSNAQQNSHVTFQCYMIYQAYVAGGLSYEEAMHQLQQLQK